MGTDPGTDAGAGAVPLGREGGRSTPGQPGDNAPHGSLPARPRDRVLRAAALAVPPLWTALGVRHAAGTLRHYLRGAGRPYRVDARALLAVPAVRAEVDRRLAQWREGARALGEPGAYAADSGWRGVLITRRGSADWWLALRGAQYRISGTVRVHADGSVVTDYRFQVHKSWNFDHGESEFGIPFTPFARLHETGLAQEFTAVGEVDGLVDAAGPVSPGDAEGPRESCPREGPPVETPVREG
ncbi:hypothetical protein OHS33_12295 [Streptomyces sp. NBC_00536]|uniref:hypothetical protein n=1 Tax=Streptomyces sp. NBC_00536 TaxID=2975769 RepID=UPI002E7FE049|nr:hypothetical protein [Streptomyces sp. NBC_00536]WUC79048.1 hypothetical protein OHS33_12295 [Streptomyces sp. NBC_00536]